MGPSLVLGSQGDRGLNHRWVPEWAIWDTTLHYTTLAPPDDETLISDLGPYSVEDPPCDSILSKVSNHSLGVPGLE